MSQAATCFAAQCGQDTHQGVISLYKCRMPDVSDLFLMSLWCVYPFVHPLAGHASAMNFIEKRHRWVNLASDTIGTLPSVSGLTLARPNFLLFPKRNRELAREQSYCCHAWHHACCSVAWFNTNNDSITSSN